MGADLRACPTCLSDLKEAEIFGSQEAAFPLDADARLVDTRSGFWDHDHCLICDVACAGEYLCVRHNGRADSTSASHLRICFTW